MSVLSRSNIGKSKGRKLKSRSYLPAAARRQQILRVARQVFASRGYHAANVAHICAAARIGRGTLYQYFENKEDVLEAVMADIATRIGGVLKDRPPLQEIAGLALAPRALIVSFCAKRVRAILDAVFEDEATLRLVLREARGISGGIDRFLRRIDEVVLGAMDADLRAARSAGLVRDLDPRLTARFILGGVEKVILHALAGAKQVDLDALTRFVVEIHLFGLLREEVR